MFSHDRSAEETIFRKSILLFYWITRFSYRKIDAKKTRRYAGVCKPVHPVCGGDHRSDYCSRHSFRKGSLMYRTLRIVSLPATSGLRGVVSVCKRAALVWSKPRTVRYAEVCIEIRRCCSINRFASPICHLVVLFIRTVPSGSADGTVLVLCCPAFLAEL